MNLPNIGIGVAVAAGALVVSLANASAAIVCSEGACWHTTETYRYPPDAHVTVHPDDWHWGSDEHYVMREHEGRGYWRGERWEPF